MYRTLLTIPYLLLLVVGLTIPSDGQHGFLSVKGISFMLSLVSFGAFFLRPNYQESLTKCLGASLCAAGILCASFLIGLLYGETPLSAQVDQFKLFLVTLYFPFATYMLLEGGLITAQTIYKTAFLATFAYVFTKVAAVSLHLLGIIDMWSALQSIGIRFMKMDIVEGLDRLQTSADIAPPFLLFFVFRADLLGLPLSKKFKVTYALLTLAATFLSFSRVLLAVYGASLFLAACTLSYRGMVKAFLALSCALLMAYIAIGPSTVHQVIERRFFSGETSYSDEVRIRQIQALKGEFLEHPFFGKGLGGYASSYIRDPDSPHSYEVQWMAFLVQFGLIGFLILLIPFIAIATALFKRATRFHFALLCTYLIFLLSGLTNPFLISLASGILYTLFALPAKPYPENLPSAIIAPLPK